MKRLFKKKTNQFIEPIANESNLDSQIYDHLNSIVKLDINGNLLTYNPSFAAKYGYNEQDLNKPFLDDFIKFETPQQKIFFEKAILGETQRFNCYGQCKNGELVDINISLIPIKTEVGIDVYVIIKDITELIEQEKAMLLLQKRQATFNELENICDFYYDAVNDHHHFSKQLPIILGIDTKEEFQPTLNQLLQYIHSDDRHKVKSTIQNAINTRSGYEIEYRLLRKDQTVRYVYEQAEILLDQNGKLDGLIGFIQDITNETEVNEIELKLNDSELTFKSVVEQAFIGVYKLEQDGQISYGNHKFYQILGLEAAEQINIWDYIHPEDQQSQKSIWNHLINGEDGIEHSFRMFRKDGTQIDIEAHSKKVYLQNNRPTIIGTLQDVTERKKVEDLNKYLAYHDPLTELPNRRLFQEELEKALVIGNALKQKVTVMYLDLDRFKYVNDTLGHPIGDKLLKEISIRLKSIIGDDHYVLARLGGDEFAILLPNAYAHQAIEQAKVIIKSLEDPFLIENYKLFITTSIGISIFPDDGQDSETLMKHADSSLYKAKDNGKNSYQIFTPSINAEAYKIFTLELDLRKALELNQLELYYQPKVSSTTNQIIGAEALIRWNHPEWGMVSPGEFIPIAEETGIILEIGKWIKETACIQIKSWQETGLSVVPISINLSAHRFLQKDLLVNIRETLAQTKIDPKYLQIEITESSLLENEKVVFSIIDEIRNLGIKINLDDFGTGYSSLSYLRRFKGKIDTLKIDRSFINDLSKTDDQGANFITKTIIDLAQHLNMEVVAEGVETVEQLEILKGFNCNTIQGYLFSKPVQAEEFAALLRNGKIEIPIVTNESDEYFGIELSNPLIASMTLKEIHGRNVELGRTEVLVEEIGLEGLQFLSDLKLTVNRGIILEFETMILGEMIKLYGAIVWMKEMKSEIYRYKIEFTMDENKRSILAQLLNELALSLKSNPLVPNCSFVNMDQYQFFK